MAGPWVGYKLDKDYFMATTIVQGSYLEVELLDEERKPQGHGLLSVSSSSRDESGIWVFGTLVVVQDPYYAHWLEGGNHPSPGWFHFCAGPVARCKAPADEPVIHLARFRHLPHEEFDKVAWLSKGIVRRKLKKLRKDPPAAAVGNNDNPAGGPASPTPEARRQDGRPSGDQKQGEGPLLLDHPAGGHAQGGLEAELSNLRDDLLGSKAAADGKAVR